MKSRLTITLPQELLARARRKAAAERRTLTSLIEEGLRLVLAEKRAFTKKRALPICTATGGPLPGIDISNSAALQEMEDLEYAERLKNGFR